MIPPYGPRPRLPAGLRVLPILSVLWVLTSACVQRESVVTSRQVIGGSDPVAESAVRSGRNLPAAFEVLTPAGVAGDCPPRLRDPGMQTVLSLEASVLQPVRDSLGVHYRAVGDYSVQPRGRYGDEQPDEGLRVDCARLRALGVVRLGTGRP